MRGWCWMTKPEMSRLKPTYRSVSGSHSSLLSSEDDSLILGGYDGFILPDPIECVLVRRRNLRVLSPQLSSWKLVGNPAIS